MSGRFKYALAFGLALATTPDLANNASSGDGLAAEVDAAIRQQMTEQHIPGLSLAVVRNGNVIKATGYGLANLEVNAPVTPETIFEAGSITKQFAATAIMLLAQEGK